MLSSYTLNTFKDHDDNLIFILVDATVEIIVKYCKKNSKIVPSKQLKLSLPLIQFFPDNHQTEESLISISEL